MMNTMNLGAFVSRPTALPLVTGARVATATVLALLLFAGCGGGEEGDPVDAESTAAGPDFTTAAESCREEVQAALDEETMSGPGLDPETVMRVGDNGESLTVAPLQTAEFLVTPSVAAAVCALDALDAPDAVVSEVQQISGLDGRQQTSWDQVQLSYSYDGSNGFTGVFSSS